MERQNIIACELVRCFSFKELYDTFTDNEYQVWVQISASFCVGHVLDQLS